MKKILFLMTVLTMLVPTTTYAEKVVGIYHSNYWNKDFDIEASDIENGKFSIYIQVPAKSESTRAMLSFEDSDVEELKGTLLQIKEKYAEWSKIARENNVTDMNKEMDFKLPSCTICWKGTKWFFSFRNRIQPSFLILDDGKHVISFVEKVTASSNRYIDETIYWIFSSPKEIDEFISILNIDKIKEKLLSKEKASDLFK